MNVKIDAQCEHAQDEEKDIVKKKREYEHGMSKFTWERGD